MNWESFVPAIIALVGAIAAWIRAEAAKAEAARANTRLTTHLRGQDNAPVVDPGKTPHP